MESTTLDRPRLKAGAEPDQGYYIANEPVLRGKTVDPPPDLVVEVDITHTDIDKSSSREAGIQALYAQGNLRATGGRPRLSGNLLKQ